MISSVTSSANSNSNCLYRNKQQQSIKLFVPHKAKTMISIATTTITFLSAIFTAAASMSVWSFT